MIHFVLWAGLLLILLLIVPRFVRTFEDFDVVLPSISGLVIAISNWVARYWYFFLIVGIVGIALDFGLLLVIGRTTRMGQLTVGVLMAVLPILLGGIVLLAIWIPMANLQRQLT